MIRLFLLLSALFAPTRCDTLSCQNKPLESMSNAEQSAFLMKAMETIRQKYVDLIPTKDLIMGAVEGMLSRTDPHSSYLTHDLCQKARKKMMGQVTGIGLELSVDNGSLGVISPLDGSPAALAGIQPGDNIVAVDNFPVESFPIISRAIKAIQGPAGSSVKLLIERKGRVKPLTFVLQRKIVHTQPVRWKRMGHIGYVRLSSFNEKTATLLKRALTELKKGKEPFYGYLIDLRNNPGGLVQQALQCCDFFVDQGDIVLTKGRTGTYQSPKKATPNKTLVRNTPCVVLINKGSASASEIMAGALQDHGIALIVGTRSFGKGSVQDMMPLSAKKDLGEIKLTIARFYTPSKHPIQGHGIQPDIIIEQMKKFEKSTDQNRSREEDIPDALAKEDREHQKNDADADNMPQNDHQLSSAFNILKTLWIQKK